ncbi:class 1b ribonucleoside-diphosphate reductase subunit alpha [Corynebacterium coyleae]|uniref:class 1b ribonucleoside-diphosphate reductase subunit alpha n=1 Tax=Corynebacterium coyleae TaxID=53374 RepID=UPI001CCF103A|nr:class 1b ribonucleoside-diphosphate reductase subunit alpha [Corynebacterium coyleae]UBI09998.1 class 1b ribonucleoside-diphosphate reductase subunit alpha [Corynebacterium coyleae]
MKKYLELNAQLNLLDSEGNLQVKKDKEAAREYFVGPGGVNENTVFFHTLKEKLDYLVNNGYYNPNVLAWYTSQEIKEIYQQAYAYKFRFESFVGAHKFYTQYALKTYDGRRYLERFEDRVAITALALAEGDFDDAGRIVHKIMTGQYQPATPTFLNAGREDAGDMVSCFLLRIEDSMESIGRAINSSLQLSKRGGGVALLLTNLRESGAPIKKVEGRASGVVPVMKILEDSFSYANQLGSRQGAGAVYLNAHHPDILQFLDTKRENADEKIRIKTLSLGVVIPDITFELARKNEPMYLFSPYDVEQVTGKPMSDLSVTDNYYDWVEDSRIRKTKISARELFQTIAEIQFESGYPYILFEDNANKDNPFPDRINMSNLCSEILQPNAPSVLSEDLDYEVIGKDISCNLGSMNIEKVMSRPEEFEETVKTAVKALTAVVRSTNIEAVPTIAEANWANRSIGLGQMNLHGFLAQRGIEYGSPEALEFVDVYFAAVRFYALWTSMEMARDTHSPFEDFDYSEYATGEALSEYVLEDDRTFSPVVQELFKDVTLPVAKDWWLLSRLIMEHGLYHSHLLAVPPTGSISYVNGATPSIHPVTAPVEIRKEGKMGRVYYPAPGLSSDTLPFYEDAYSLGYQKLIDTYAVATKHTDQGLSCTLFVTDQFSTRDLNKAYIYAWRKGLKTLYYTRVRQAALEGTEIEGCVSCTL